MNPKHHYQDKVAEIVSNAEQYHSAYYAAKTFRGPSLYFHQRALESRHSPDFTQHLEYIYATLASWGMHRMGKGGSKMQSFGVFSNSVEPLQDKIQEAAEFDYQAMTESNWLVLEHIFRSIKVMATRTILIGNSKVMAHLIPNIVPPIDREYTLLYLRGNKNIRNDPAREWALMRGIIEDFFIPVAKDSKLISLAKDWMSDPDNFPWDTSILKIVDNLVIGSRK